MKVKLFSHASDPDGIGCVILAKLAFKDIDFTLCKDPKELNEVLEKFLEEKNEKKYDKIYVTDLCPKDEILKRIEEKNISNFKVFDHHKTSREALSKKYDFVTSINTFNGVSCCATNLFYEHLKKFYDIKNPYTDTLVEYTRLHDTYDWKPINHMDAFHLQTLFQFLGCYGYFYHFYLKCLNSPEFFYDEEEIKWIKIQREKNIMKLQIMMNHVVFKKEKDMTFASVIGEYEFRNLMANKIESEYSDVDVFLLLAYDNDSASLRALKDKNVDILAKEYGGGGHEKAASIPLTQENELKLIKRFLI